jgi:hypothetical protein
MDKVPPTTNGILQDPQFISENFKERQRVGANLAPSGTSTEKKLELQGL